MALQTSGAISLANIATEFGGATPHSLSEYYGVAAGIPTSGAIDLADFYGASAEVTSTITVTAGYHGQKLDAVVGYTLNTNEQVDSSGWPSGGIGSRSPTTFRGVVIECMATQGVDAGTADFFFNLQGNRASSFFKRIEYSTFTLQAANATRTYVSGGNFTRFKWLDVGFLFANTSVYNVDVIY